MIFEGLKLMLAGMGVVFLFLILLFFTITVLSKVLAPYTRKEIAELAKKVPQPVQGQILNSNFPADDEDKRVVAAITAAITAYRQGAS